MPEFAKLAVLAAALAAFSSSAGAQSRCKDGTRATLSGTIQKIERAEPEPGVRIWMITPAGKASGACAVDQVWGRGQPPAGCTQGRSFTAGGKVVNAESLWLLNVDSASCK